MVMKSLFDKNAEWNEAARYLDQEAHDFLKNIFKEYMDQGYSPREISHIIHGSVTDLEIESVLDMNIDKDD